MDFLPWKKMLLAYALYVAYQNYLKPKKNLKGQIAVITGAGSGIGRLMALRLAKMGVKIAIIDVNMEGAESVAAEVNKISGSEGKAFKCDVTKPERVYEVANEVLEHFGACDILINNAGIVSGKKLLDEPDRLTELTVQVNTIAPMFLLKGFLPGMIERKRGHVVTIASSAGLVGTRGLVSYCASKFGAVGLADSLRAELRYTCPEIQCLTVCPMYIKTGMFKGATLRSPIKPLEPLLNILYPLLEPDYVADSIIDAIRRNKTMLVMPKMAEAQYVLRAFLPFSMVDMIIDIMGISNSMDTFQQTREN